MLKVEVVGPVLHVVLDRPEVRNAFNDELIQAMSHAFSNLPPGIRVVVLSGEGKAFCAGGDLEWMRKAASYTVEENHRDALRLARLFRMIVESPVPVIAKVHGAAFGGGCGLVAAADIAVAAPDAKFAFSEVKLGLIPATISTIVIPKIGSGHARSLFTTGEAFDAHRALKIGLIHEISDDLDGAVTAKLQQILASGPEAIAGAKRLVHDFPMTLDEAAGRLARARASNEAKEGVDAFLQKRPASFVEKLDA